MDFLNAKTYYYFVGEKKKLVSANSLSDVPPDVEIFTNLAGAVSFIQKLGCIPGRSLHILQEEYHQLCLEVLKVGVWAYGEFFDVLYTGVRGIWPDTEFPVLFGTLEKKVPGKEYKNIKGLKVGGEILFFPDIYCIPEKTTFFTESDSFGDLHFDNVVYSKHGNAWLEEMVFYGAQQNPLVTLFFSEGRDGEPICHAKKGGPYSDSEIVRVIGIRQLVANCLVNLPLASDWQKYIPLAQAVYTGWGSNGVLYYAPEERYHPLALTGDPLLELKVQYGPGCYRKAPATAEGLKELFQIAGQFSLYKEALETMEDLLSVNKKGKVVELCNGYISIIDGSSRKALSDAYYQKV